MTAFKPTSSGHTLHHWSCRSVGLLFHWRCHTVALYLADVGILPTSDTQNRQGSSLRGNLSHRVQTPVRSVPKDPFVATRRTALASHPNSQGMDPLHRLGGFTARFLKHPAQRLCLLEQGIRWQRRHHFCSFTRGNIIIHLIAVI